MAHVAAAALFRPAEWERQSQVLMAWPSAQNDAYQGAAHDLKRATEDVSMIAEAVSSFEPVTLLVTPDRISEAEERLGHNPTNISIQPVDNYPKLDLWMRDMAPTFVLDTDGGARELAGVDFNFNGWGEKYPVGQCLSLAAINLAAMGLPRVCSPLVAEGGSLEVDGEGTVMLTESSVLNDNRNPGWSRADVEAELRRTLGVTVVLWVPGRKGLEVTDGHIDGLARFVAPGHVLLSRPSELDDGVWTKIYEEARDILHDATDAKGRRLQVTEVAEADVRSMGLGEEALADIESGREDAPALTYVNYLLVNGGVIFPQFGDEKADAAALKTIQGLYKNRVVETVLARELPFLGGGIHCSTQEVPYFL
ncbi:Agmatine deiminase [Cordyceps fumosorosea ARSEF 2679]|uniref:Agmatine deiminase n=1 Tax=Cordyceps fumosorosea (strain ARSEF 2679) TaxID=1081104 RepID=A0A167VZ04_CORFA|nr:Agmatine deiminase [Cordyceps fumosorosea ARSEF 2679]OAA63136.1 Agmatine deiminase [Cordyceps fumosorosea ARSEF 2679]